MDWLIRNRVEDYPVTLCLLETSEDYVLPTKNLIMFSLAKWGDCLVAQKKKSSLRNLFHLLNKFKCLLASS